MQLSVRAGLRRGQGIESGPEQSADRGIEIAVGDPLIDAGQGRLTETSHDSRMAFLAEAARIGREVLLHGQEPVPNGIVQGRPHERPRQRVDDPRHRGDRRLRRCRVETHPSVVQVVVVEQGDHTGAAPDELFDLGGCGGELAAERVQRNDRTTRAAESGDLDRVGPQQSRTSRRIGLGDGRGRDLLRSGPSARSPSLGSAPGAGPTRGVGPAGHADGGNPLPVTGIGGRSQPGSRARGDADPASRALGRVGGRGIGGGQFQRQLGHPGCAQPGTGPVCDVPVGGRLGEAVEEVSELGIAVLEPFEVQPGPGEEGVSADEGHELFEHGRTLGIGDAVEVELRGLDIGDVGDDRMRRRIQILRVRPGLPPQCEGHPAVREPGRLGQSQPAHVVGEGLLEPQIVPPLHRHQVSEPHVRHLVEDDVRA